VQVRGNKPGKVAVERIRPGLNGALPCEGYDDECYKSRLQNSANWGGLLKRFMIHAG
jgi:hypothetical protein